MDYRLYFVTAKTSKSTHAETALAAARGGATVIQFRDKIMNDADFKAAALDVKKVADSFGLPLIINDRVLIAAEIGVAGVHVGQGDSDISSVRALVGPGRAIGCSAATVEQALRAEYNGADYIGAGPVFLTGSKDDADPPIGLALLKGICETVRIPVVAIGGISAGNLNKIIESGAAGAAVISAVTEAPDMEIAAAELLNIWENKK